MRQLQTAGFMLRASAPQNIGSAPNSQLEDTDESGATTEKSGAKQPLLNVRMCLLLRPAVLIVFAAQTGRESLSAQQYSAPAVEPALLQRQRQRSRSFLLAASAALVDAVCDIGHSQRL